MAPFSLQVKSLFSGAPSHALTAEERETFTSGEFNRLAAIFNEVLGSETGPASFQVASFLSNSSIPMYIVPLNSKQ